MENYTYMTLLTNNTYVQGVILLNETLKKVKSKYPLIVLVTNEVAQAILDILDYLKIKWKLVDIVETPIYLQKINNKKNKKIRIPYNCLTKFQIFNQYEYDKICYLDSDIMILKNIDFLFNNEDFTCTLNFAYQKTFPDKFLSKDVKTTNTEKINNINLGFFIFNPKKEKINLINFIQNIPEKEFDNRDRVIDDEEILWIYLRYNTLKINLLNYYFNIMQWPVNFSEEVNNDILKNGYFIHFYGFIKPWNIGKLLYKDKKILDINFPYIEDHNLINQAIEIITNRLYSLPINLFLKFQNIYYLESFKGE